MFCEVCKVAPATVHASEYTKRDDGTLKRSAPERHYCEACSPHPIPEVKMRFPIIAFGHQSRVGKNEAAKGIALLQDQPGFMRFEDGTRVPVRLASFAGALKDVAYKLFASYGLREGAFYETPEGAELRDVPLPVVGKSPVQLWIDVGQKMRDVYPGVWVDACLAQRSPGHLLVIMDLRFDNEGDAVRKHGGICVKVERPGAPPPKGSDNEIRAEFPWDDRIVNDGSVEELHGKAQQIARDYMAAFVRCEE